MFAGVASKASPSADRRAALVIRHQRRHVGRRRHGDALGLLRRDEHADRAVVALEISRGDGLDLFRRDLLDAVAVQEIKPPIALRRPFAERHADLRGVRGRALARFENLLLGAVDFLGRDAFRADFFGGGDQQVAHFLERTVARHFGVQRSASPDRARARAKAEALAAFFVSTSAL